MKQALLILGILCSTAPAAELVTYETCHEGKQAFEQTVFPHVRSHCIKCHEQGPGPRFAPSSANEAYEILLAKTHFTSPTSSRLHTKGGDGHCLDHGYDCKTDEKVISGLIAAWWEKGQKDCKARKWRELETKPAAPGRMEFSLGLPGAILSVAVTLNPKTETVPFPTYVIKDLKITAGQQSLNVKGVQFLLNGNAFGYPDSFESVTGRISAQSTQTLSSESVVIPKTESTPDQLTLAMETVHPLNNLSHPCRALDLFRTNVYPLMDYRCSVCHGVAGREAEKPTNARRNFPIPIEGRANEESLALLCAQSLDRIEAPNLLESPLFRLAFGGDRAHRNVASLLDETIPKDVKKIYPDWFEWALKERELMESK